MNNSLSSDVESSVSRFSCLKSAGLALALVSLATSSFAQNLPPELQRKRTRSIDPALPETIRKIVEAASKAELDPKRGLGNALQILRAERKNWRDEPRTLMALELRLAATLLRSRFVNNKRQNEPTRYQQALSTYSKLELSDPGLDAWLERTLDKNRDVKKKLTNKRGKKIIPVAVLSRGTGLKNAPIFNQLKKRFRVIGFDLKKTKVKTARYLFKFGSDEVRDKAGKPMVRVALNVESRIKGRIVWKQSFFRTSEATLLADAIDDNLDWLVRIGGRDVLFNWLRFHGLEEVFMKIGGAHEHKKGDEKGHRKH